MTGTESRPGREDETTDDQDFANEPVSADEADDGPIDTGVLHEDKPKQRVEEGE